MGQNASGTRILFIFCHHFKKINQIYAKMFGKKQNEENQPFSTLALKTHAGNTVSKKRRKCAIWFNTYFSIFKQLWFLAFGVNSVNSNSTKLHFFFQVIAYCAMYCICIQCGSYVVIKKVEYTQASYLTQLRHNATQCARNF